MEPKGDIRPMMRRFYNEYDKKEDIVGVEIGTQRGINALNILENFNIKMLYLIDSYFSYDGYPESLLENSYDAAKKRLESYNNKTFIIKKSEDALQDVPDKLDFIYIDGNHEYEYVKKDIQLWYPKIVDGGYIGGHDFNMNFPGVVKAVREFVRKNNITNRWYHHNDWLIIKE